MWRIIAGSALLSATIAAQLPTLETLDLAPGRNSLDLVFRSALVNAAGQNVEANCTVNQKPAPGALAPNTLDRIRIPLDMPLVAGNQISVACAPISYFDGPDLRKMPGISTSATVPESGQYQKLLLDRITKEAAAAKTQQEQDLFASGFLTAASSGTAGGLDLALNPSLGIRGLKSFLQIKASTQAGADARSFEAGARYQLFYLSDRKAFEAIQGMGGQPLPAILESLRAHEPKSWYGRIFVGTSIDLALKLEGSPGAFNVTNLVAGTSFTLRSRSRGFAGRKAFIRGFLTPGGVEYGQSHISTTPAPPPGTVARIKAGGGVRIHYAGRIELAAETVARYLFQNEATWDSATNTLSATSRGLRPYTQLDCKVYIGQMMGMSYGWRISLNRGSLPPVYASVRSVQVGFVVESKPGQ